MGESRRASGAGLGCGKGRIWTFCFAVANGTRASRRWGVHAGGRGSRAIAMAAAKKGVGGLWDVTEGVANMRVMTLAALAGSAKVTGAASLGFGGAAGVRVQAFNAPPRGVEVAQFPDGKGHFWPKMPIWSAVPVVAGGDWGLDVANCGATPGHDNNQRPTSTGDSSSSSGDGRRTVANRGASVANVVVKVPGGR